MKRGSGLRALLFEVSPFDPLTLGTTMALILAVAVAAAWWPATRALRVAPAAVLRVE